MNESARDAEDRLLAFVGRVELAAALPESAQAAARRAIEAFAEGAHHDTALQAGLAVELLAKCIVLRLDPAALAAKHAGSLMYLDGDGHPDMKSPVHLRTKGPDKVLRHALSLLGLPQPDESDLNLLIQTRNTAAHLGYARVDLSNAAVGALVRCVTPLLRTEHGTTFTEWIGFRDDPLDTALCLLPSAAPGPTPEPLSFGPKLWTARVLARAWVARRSWADLQSRFPPELLAAIATDPLEPSQPGFALRQCPTGSHLAWFTVEVDDDFIDGEEDGSVYQAEILDSVDCPLCGLRLEGPMELAVLKADSIVDWRFVEPD